MIRVRIESSKPVIVGHRQLLPGEIHYVAGGDLNAAVVLYGADAFKLLDSAPVVTEPGLEGAHDGESDAQTGDSGDGDDETTGDDDGSEPGPAGAPEGTPTSRRSRKTKGTE